MKTEGIQNRVELRNISKRFGGISALKGVTLKVRPGEIHALLGENGAGKSTLMKILSGAYTKDQGEIYIDDQAVNIRNTHDSKHLGIGIIYQEFSLVPALTVAENIFLNQFSTYGIWLKRNKMKTEAEALIRSLGFDIKATSRVANLSIAQQQIVEIAKALALEVKVLILDEPSAVLGPHEISKLFETLQHLKQKGVAIIYISHRLAEIFEIGDRVTILRNGSSSESLRVSETDKNALIRLMLGRPLDAMFPARKAQVGEELFRVDHLTMEEKVRDVSLSLRAGEVVGLAGLVGSGRTEALRGIFSAEKRVKGRMRLFKKEINPTSPRQAVRLGMGMVPEDRKQHGLILALSVKHNISLTNLRAIAGKLGFIHPKREYEIAGGLIDNLHIKLQDQNVKAGTLSGGNQQKVVLAKWLNRDCKIMLIDEPTRGVDVGAKVEIYNQINRLAEKGLGIVVVSSETAELMGICDRIVVLHDGLVRGELVKEQFSEENILRLSIDAEAP